MTSRWRKERPKRVQVGRATRWMAREETRVYRVYQRRPRGTSENWQYKPLAASPRSRIALGKCVRRNWTIGAGNGARTRDIQLGKLTLYQLSYARAIARNIAEAAE